MASKGAAKMDFAYTKKVNGLRQQLMSFMERFIYPNEKTYRDQIKASGNPHYHTEIIDELKVKAKAEGLWNLFLPDDEYGAGLTNLEYAPLAEIMGRVSWSSEVFNCSAPDTGNMEILAQFGTPEQKRLWLRPLLDGEIRSAFAMTEPDVASSDATNIQLTILREGDEYVLNVRVPVSNLLGEEGSGFAIAQARLGPGRIHHCMRSVGAAQRALELMAQRAATRAAFGKPLSEQGMVQDWIARSQIEIEQARLLTLKAAWTIDTLGKKAAQNEIAMIKIIAPQVHTTVVDRAIQLFGGAGVSDDFPLASMWAHGRTLHIADGPDEVHKRSLARSVVRQLST